MKNQYLTKLRVMIREDADILRELTEMLHDFAYSYNAQLQQAGQVDHFNPQAQAFLEGYEALKQDSDVWVGQIAFSDALELQAMWNNREIWPRRLAGLPPIAPPNEGSAPEPSPRAPYAPWRPGCHADDRRGAFHAAHCVLACVEINQCVGASRGDSGRTRRIFDFHTGPGAPAT